MDWERDEISHTLSSLITRGIMVTRSEGRRRRQRSDHSGIASTRTAFTLISVLSLFLGAPTGHAAGTQKATQEGLTQLTAANWSTEIKHGAWLIEFYSPFSSHCKEFLPTWIELVSNKEPLRTAYPDAPFSFAQVDCIAQNDICVAEKVKHMPRLIVYKDGVQMEGEYQGYRAYTEMSTFVNKEAAEYRKSKGVSEDPHPIEVKPAGTPQGAISSPLTHVSAQDGKLQGGNGEAPPPPAAPAMPPPAPAPQPPPPPPPPPAVQAPAPPPQEHAVVAGPNPNGVVLKYGKDEAVKDRASLKQMLSKEAGPSSTFVKFFASWCPHCKAMASAFVQVGEALRGRVNVVEVDCEAFMDVCQQYGIRSFPTLRMYNEGEATEYRGDRSFEAMRNWAVNAGSASGVREVNSNEIDRLRNSEEVFFLYLYSANTPEREIEAVTKASRVLLTTPVHVYRSMDSQLLTRYQSRLAKGSLSSTAASGSLSGLLVFKDHDGDQPTAAYYPSSLSPKMPLHNATAKVASWFEKERYATVAEVTGTTFSDIIHNKQDAPVVLAALSDVHHSGRTQRTGSGSQIRDEELQAMRSLARAWRHRGAESSTGSEQGGSEHHRWEKVIFAWIDADRWATAIKTYYNIKAEQVPKLVLADGARLEYYPLPSHFIDPFSTKRQAWLDNEQVFEALELIRQNKGAKARSSRTYLDRGVRGTTGAIEAFAMAIAHHPLLSLCIFALAAFAIVSSLRSQARRMVSTQRLPHYSTDKAD